MSLPKPFYSDEWATIYHANCHTLFRRDSFDCLITDPPYGVNLGVATGQRRDGGYGGHLGKAAYRSYSDTYENFKDSVVPALRHFIYRTKRAAIFSGPNIHEQEKPEVIGGIHCPCATGRTPWGSKNFLPILFYGKPHSAGRHRPTVLTSTLAAEENGHPCPKPIEWMLWLVGLASEEGETILDPFMGSGTTLVAAKQLGRKSIGIELEEKYCEIAAKRLQQEYLPLTIEPTPHPQPIELFK